jgi:hypothetical protein
MAFIVFGRTRMNEAIRQSNLEKMHALPDKGLSVELQKRCGHAAPQSFGGIASKRKTLPPPPARERRRP